MTNKNVKIWIWIQSDNKVYKAISNKENGTLTIYDENDKILIKRTGLNQEQLKKIEITIKNYGAKRMDGNEKPFTIL